MTAPKKVLKKKPQAGDQRRPKGEVTRDSTVYFKVTFNPRTPEERSYQYPTENGAVLFACIHSREHGWTARVDDPNGRNIVTFHKREYDVSTQKRRSTFDNETLDELQVQVATARAKRLAAPTKKVLKKR